MKKQQLKRTCTSLLFASLLLMGACGNGETATETITYASSVTETSAAEETRPKLATAAADFKGAAVRTYSINTDYDWLTYMDVEQETGEVISDAVCRRNRTIEAAYNVDFQGKYSSTYQESLEMIRKMTLSDSDEYDLVMLINRNAFTAAQEGLVMPVSALKIPDIDAEWYMSEVNEQIDILDEMYILYGGERLQIYDGLVAVAFNKVLLENLALEDPYYLVRNGKWTVDKFYEMATKAISDLDGDGEMGLNDRYGIISEKASIYASLWIGSGLKTVTQDKNNIPAFTAPGDKKLIGLFEKIIGYHNSSKGMLRESFTFPNDGGQDVYTKAAAMFAGGGALFRMGPFSVLRLLRSMYDDFGLLPVPKYDEKQDRYYSNCHDGWIHVVPITNKNPERMGVILDALNYYRFADRLSQVSRGPACERSQKGRFDPRKARALLFRRKKRAFAALSPDEGGRYDGGGRRFQRSICFCNLRRNGRYYGFEICLMCFKHIGNTQGDRSVNAPKSRDSNYFNIIGVFIYK